MLEYLMLITGLALLIKGADFLIDGSSFLAHKYGVSSLFIGLTVLAFGTSLPELVVNIISALKGSGELVFGNIIGSNMSNILLVLGMSALFITIKIQDSTTKKEIPYSIFAVLILIIFSFAYMIMNKAMRLSIIEGIILLIALGFFMKYVINMARNDRKKTIEVNVEFKKIPNLKLTLMILGGLTALYLGGRWTVNGAIIVAQNLGLSEFLISATIIAIGTSLPELIVSIIAATKKEVNMLVGNIVGSNIFNILWVIGATALITPIEIPSKIIIDLTILLFTSFFLLFIAQRYKSLNKYHGATFLIMYVMYLAFLILRG